ncbi:MAG: putative Ig domain-containing protein, partial [Acidimicrobiales bacterium]|nr:putative Ig domain-containing protein [Acidimicrobiales bacterium]
FHDVTTGNNDLSGHHGGAYPATAGYDMATGLGTPDAANLAPALCAASAPSPVTVTNPGNQHTVVGTAVSLQITANDSNPGQTLAYRAVGLPAGLTIGAATGLVRGTPTAAGTAVVTVTAKDGTGAAGSASFDWAVANTVTSAPQATATIGVPFSFTFTASGSPTKLTVVGTRPKGIKRQQSGGTAALSGTPSKAAPTGDYPFTVTATYGSGKSATSVTQAFTLVLQA